MVLGQEMRKILLRLLVWKADSLVMCFFLSTASILIHRRMWTARSSGKASVCGCAALRWPPHIALHAEGLPGLIQSRLDVTARFSIMSDSTAEAGELFSHG